tara:strand:- start:249 stop:662 length:414 start_codon:yes stop_codon:yes gene_type:complete
MVTFRNNNRRSSYRNNNNRRSSFRNNNDIGKFSNNDNFQRRSPGRNNHNAVKLIEKYNDLAREALASGDKILSENYFQHADHFTRIQKEQENAKIARVNSSLVKSAETEVKNENQSVKENISEEDDKKTIEKKSAAS